MNLLNQEAIGQDAGIRGYCGDTWRARRPRKGVELAL